ncbi:MAG: dihydroorotate dehydrogenase electron transfer subunit [Candidatus Hydrothermarchaeales archaeon]
MYTVKIKKVINETKNIKTFRLDLDLPTLPGQYVMLWVPGYDEKPLSVSYPGRNMGITVLKKGVTTTHLHDMKAGDIVGVRGPFGRAFKISGKELIAVGGGVGMAPIAPLAERAIEQGKEITVIVGAVTKSELLFVDRLEKAGAKIIITTDDGTCGKKCFTTNALEEELGNGKYDECFTCGPEIMMVKVLEIGKRHDLPTQVSMERYFKCGIGICGHCVMDDGGLRVCKEGPNFRDVEVEKFKDFGRYTRDASGKKIYW